MRWRQLQAFRETMLTGTVSAAAEIMGVSQPAVSRLIDALEESLEMTLFDRATGRLVPTAEARLFHAELQKAFDSYDRLATVARDIKFGRRGSLHVACLPAIGLGFLPGAVAAYAAVQPDVYVRYDLQLSLRVEEYVSAQQVDLGIAEFPLDRPGFEREDFCRVPYVLALPRGHPLSRCAVVRPADLQSERLVSLSREAVARRILDTVFAEAGVTARIVCETMFAASLCTLVHNGMGVGIVDLFTAHDFAGTGLVFRRFEPEIEFHAGLLYPRHLPLSRATSQFVAILRQRRNDLIVRSQGLLEV